MENSGTSSAITAGAAPRLRRVVEVLSRTWVLGLVLVVAALAVRTPALPGDLIWDDGFLIRENPFIKSPVLFFETFRNYLLLDSLSTHYRPVQNVSYMLDYWLWNTNSYGFHLSNVFWHTGSALLLFLLLRQLLPGLLWRRADVTAKSSAAPGRGAQPATLFAFLLALLWAVHPVHSAAIDYISGRADSLAFFFAAGAWLLFLAGRHSARRAVQILCYSLAPCALLLALCSRESACMWVIVFLLHLFIFQRGVSGRGKVLVLTTCLLVVGAYAGLRQLPERRANQMPSDGWSAPMRGVLMLRALGDYGRLMVFPSNLHMERTVVNSAGWRDNKSWREAAVNDYLTVLGLLVLAALVAGAVRRGPGQPLRIFGAGWFLLAYLPISNLLDLNATVAEHWLYLPSVGLLLFLSGIVVDLPRVPRQLATIAGCLAVLALGARSYVRSSDWVDDKTFYTRTLQTGGGSIRVILNLGMIYSNEGDLARAEGFFRKALQLYPDYLIARNNLADVLQRQGKNEEAQVLFREATAAAPEAKKHFPRTWAAALNLAKMHVRDNDTAAALQVLENARKEYPKEWRIVSLQSELLRRQGGPAAALPAVQEFTKMRWWHLPAAIAAGKLHHELGNYAEAEAQFRHASRLDVHDVEALNQTALLAVNQERFEEAYSAQRRAVARQPDGPRQYLILSDILVKMGRNAEAQDVLAHVTRMQAVAEAAALPN